MFHIKRSHNGTCKIRKNSSNLDEVVESNHATITFGSFDPVSLHVPPKTLGACVDTIQCKSSKLKQTQVSYQDTFFTFALIMNQCHIVKKIGHW